MIFITKIQNIGDSRVIHIPNMYNKYEYSREIIHIDGGNANTESNILLDGGYSNSIFSNTMDSGTAQIGSTVVNYNVIDCGGAFQQSVYNFIDGGDANTLYSSILDGGNALYIPKNSVEVNIVHTISRRNINSFGILRKVNDNGIDVNVTFSEIPPVGQYYIKVIKGDEIIYNGLLQIGDTKQKNKEYNKEIIRYIYE